MASIAHWVRGHSAFEIDCLSHKKTRVVFAIFDKERTSLAWYLFSSTVDPKTQRQYETAEVLIWDDPEPFAEDAGVASSMGSFKNDIGVDELIKDAKSPVGTIKFDGDMNCSLDNLNTKSNGFVHLGFHMHKNAPPPKPDVAIRGKVFFLEVAPIPAKDDATLQKMFDRGPQGTGSQIAISGPVF